MPSRSSPTDQPRERAAGRRPALNRRDAVGVLALLVVSTAVAVLALASADGVEHLGGATYTTEFVSGWWWLAFLLAPAPAVLGRGGRRAGAAAVVALVAPHVVAAGVCVARYRSAGWSDGLEGLAFLHPVLLGGAAATLVALAGRRRPPSR